MEQLFLLKYGEITLKGRNKHLFENKLIQSIKRQFYPLTGRGSKLYIKLTRERSKIMFRSNINTRELTEGLSRVFGLSAFALVHECPLDMNVINTTAVTVAREWLTSHPELSRPINFKLETKRSNKNFPLDTMAINRISGGFVMDSDAGRELQVNLSHPVLTITVEINKEAAHLYADKIRGAGGLPEGTSGRGVLLLSGGIDSPVAGWMMMKRGLWLTPVYFHSHPYVGDRSKEKVIEIARVLEKYQRGLRLYIVPFADIQTRIMEHSPSDFLTVLMRRAMTRIANKIAENEKASALVTGDNLGQVASQTLQALRVAEDASRLPILRPLLGFDKQEIVDRAKVIGSFETSILPYDDCCAAFVPKNPVLSPPLEKPRLFEEKLEWDQLIDDAVNNSEKISVAKTNT